MVPCNSHVSSCAWDGDEVHASVGEEGGMGEVEGDVEGVSRRDFSGFGISPADDRAAERGSYPEDSRSS